MKTLNANDDKTVNLSKEWLDLSKKANDPAAKKAADAALTNLVDHLVAHSATAEEKRPARPTLSTNHGFTPAFTKAIEADTKDFTALKALTDRYNERAKAAELPGRVDLKIDDRKDGNRYVDIKPYDSRDDQTKKNKAGASKPQMTIHYHLKPGDKILFCSAFLDAFAPSNAYSSANCMVENFLRCVRTV